MIVTFSGTFGKSLNIDMGDLGNKISRHNSGFPVPWYSQHGLSVFKVELLTINLAVGNHFLLFRILPYLESSSIPFSSCISRLLNSVGCETYISGGKPIPS